MSDTAKQPALRLSLRFTQMNNDLIQARALLRRGIPVNPVRERGYLAPLGDRKGGVELLGHPLRQAVPEQ